MSKDEFTRGRIKPRHPALSDRPKTVKKRYESHPNLGFRCAECGFCWERYIPPKRMIYMPRYCSKACETIGRFWPKVDKRGRNECWPWTASKSHRGYGRFMISPKVNQAHRVAWELTNGPIPKGLLVCHKCDNPPCCNPAHLFLGTDADNVADRDAKGRGNSKKVSGELSGSAKLTESQVLAIRAEYATGNTSLSKLGKKYGVVMSVIGRIVRGELWKHLLPVQQAAQT